MAKQKGKKKEERGSGSVESQKILLLRIKAYDEAVRYSTLFTLFIAIFFVFYFFSNGTLLFFFVIRLDSVYVLCYYPRSTYRLFYLKNSRIPSPLVSAIIVHVAFWRCRTFKFKVLLFCASLELPYSADCYDCGDDGDTNSYLFLSKTF